MSAQTSAIDQKLLDLSIRLGQGCWGAYCCSKIGFIRVFMLPNNKVRRRANELFQCGFREHAVPSRLVLPHHFNNPLPLGAGVGERNNVTRMIEGEAYRPSGTDLDGPAYPDTPKVVLDYAREFFLEGFSAGTIAVQEILSL